MKKPNLDSTNCIRVIANVLDVDTNRYSIEVEFQDVKGIRSTAILPRAIIRSGVRASEELLNRGAQLPTGHGASAQVASLLSVVPDRTYRITGRTGWRGQSFVLPDITIGPDADTLIHASRKSGKPSQRPTQGSLQGWLDGLRKPCLASSYLTFGIGLAFAGPLRRLVGQHEGDIFYLAGKSSTGKTLTELAGLSAIEKAERDLLLTHDATDRRIEEDCAAHNDLMQVIDEISRMTGSQAVCRAKVCRLAHKIAGGGGSRRSAKARQDVDLADLDWRVSCLWSGEYSLGADYLGSERARGELVRLIEIPVPEPEDGIFDRLGAVQLPRIKLVKQAERAVEENFGHPIREFIARLVGDPETHARRATELIDKFLQKVGAGTDPWARRYATKFAVVYAAARLAAELEVAPWPPGHPLKCVQRVYKAARAQVVTPEEAFTALLHQLANNAFFESRFPKVKKGDSLPENLKSKAWGIRHKTQAGVSCLAIEAKKLDRLVNPPQYAGQVRKLLHECGYTLAGKEGRHVRQIKVQGFGSIEKPYFVCVRLDRLPKQDS
jgi:putative DNA primase/helicase